MPPPVLFHHPSSANHLTGSHPECPARIRAIEAALEARDWLGHDVRVSPAATPEQLRAVHPDAYLRAVERACATGTPLDADTIVSPGSWEAALHSAGGTVALVDALLAGEAKVGSALHRPPGHHAEPAQAMGFCLLANVAIAARHAIATYGLERILVLDWDVHHGNGTNDIFYTDPRVLFCSVHEWPLWPGTGAATQIGAGDGIGYSLNVPVPAGSGDDLWCSLVAHAAVPLARAYRPQLILVSAGYDAHADDPLANCTVSDAGFQAMSQSVGALAEELDVPLGIVLEGGYDLGALARCVTTTLEVLTPGPRGIAAPDVAVHPLAARALGLVSARWASSGSEPLRAGPESYGGGATPPVGVVGVVAAGVVAAGVVAGGVVAEPGVIVVGVPIVEAGGVAAPAAGGRAGAAGAAVLSGGPTTAVTVALPGGASVALSETSATALVASARAPTAPTTRIGRFQFGTGATRVRAATPQVTHQSCSGPIAEPQRGHAMVPGGGPPGGSGGVGV